MDHKMKLAMAVVGGLLVVGCGNKDNSVPAAAQNNANTAANAAQDAGNNAAAAANSASNMAAGAMNTAANAASNAASAATNAAGAGVAATDAANNDAMSKMKQVRDYIASQKFDQADSALKDLEGKKSSLPQAVQDELPNMRKAVDAGKAAAGAMGGVQMPKMGN